MRMRALKEDKNDDVAFRHARSRTEGYNMETEFHQIAPHFFTRDRASVSIEGLYKGCSIFMICNGPSFAGLDHSLLNNAGIMTFGINNGAKTFRPNFWTLVDDPVRFLKSIWLDPKITKFVPQSHMPKHIFDNEKWQPMDITVGECPNVIGYMRNEKFKAERWLTETSCNWGSHSSEGGGRSVMLPAIKLCYLLGFRTIYLLGCDMKMTEEYTYHFDEQRSKGAVKGNNSTYDRLKNEYFPSLKPEFDKAGLNVFNCYKDSGLKVFPYMSYEDAIKEATRGLGDIKNERTWGMYSKPEEKPQWQIEPPDEAKKNLKVLEMIKQGNLQTEVKIEEESISEEKPKLPFNNEPEAMD